MSAIGRKSNKHAFPVYGSHTKEAMANPSTHCLTACNASCGLEVRAQDNIFCFGEVVRAENHAYVSIQRHWLALYMDTALFQTLPQRFSCSDEFLEVHIQWLTCRNFLLA